MGGVVPESDTVVNTVQETSDVSKTTDITEVEETNSSSGESDSRIVDSDSDTLTALEDSEVKEIIEEAKTESTSVSTEEPDLLTEIIEEIVEDTISNITVENSTPQDSSSLNQDYSNSLSNTSSLYTVDFTANGTTYSIAGDSKKVKLSTILNNINIAGDISDVKVFMDEDCTEDAENGVVAVDGKTLFSVYKDDDGEWYVDSSNAFSSVHCLKVLLPDSKEYKIKVTDAGLKIGETISYIDENGEEKSDIFTLIEDFSWDQQLSTTGLGQNLAFKGIVNLSCGLVASGNVKLVLMDGCKLTVSGLDRGRTGLDVLEGDNNITIYGQKINNGELIAIGDTQCAGIGNQGSFGNITINGGIITAIGGICAAGIGSGGNGRQNSGKITINGGIITATGGSGAAGIGGGNNSSETVIINGGNITANAGEYGAGIGGGYGGSGTVIINGGNITATAGLNADAIGNGYDAQSPSNVTIDPSLYVYTDGTLLNKTIVAYDDIKNPIKVVKILSSLPESKTNNSSVGNTIFVKEIDSSELSDVQRNCVDSIIKIGKKAVNYIRCSFNGIIKGKANQIIKIKSEFLKELDPSDVHIWYLDSDGTYKEAETSVYKDGSVLIHNGYLGYYLITD